MNWLEVDFEIGDTGKFDGSIWGFDAGIRWQTWKNIGFALKYTFFDIDLTVDDGTDFGGEFEYKYNGPRLGINWYF